METRRLPCRSSMNRNISRDVLYAARSEAPERDNDSASGADMNTTIRQLSIDDVHAVARVHMISFPRAVLTRLGSDVVVAYYRALFDGENDLYATGAFDDDSGALLGFVIGGILSDLAGTFVTQNWGLVAARLMRKPWLVVDPLFRDRVRRGLRAFRRKRGRSRPRGTRRNNRHVVLSLAVDPSARNHGVARSLMLDQEAHARVTGRTILSLTVARDNHAAIGLYERLGYERHLETPGNVWRGQMRKAVGADSSQKH